MAKGKKNPTQAQQVEQQAAGQDLQLPIRPERLPGTKAPGNPVALISNLYLIALKSNKPIYCHTITVDILDTKQADTGDNKKPTVSRKIPKHMRHQAAKQAVEEWLRNNPQKLGSVTCKYALDGNASTMCSLFRMLDEHDGKSGTRRSLQIESSAPNNFIENKKVVVKPERMLVKIYSPTLIDVPKLFDYCAGKHSRSSVEVEATLKAFNIIASARYLEDPKYLNMQHKSGMATTFPLGKENQFKISEGVICNKGFTTSIRPSEKGPVAVISNTCAPFFEPLTLLQLLRDRYRVNDFSKPLAPYIISELKRELRTKQVEATHINYGDKAKPHYRKYRVHDIGKPTVQESFDLKDDKTGKTTSISVFDYFRKEYPKCPLRYPNLPCILDNKRKIPLEICQLVDKQKVNRKLEPMETSNVIRQMAVKPEIHFDNIRKSANDVIQHSQPMNDFGLQIEQTPIEVTGRELPQITLLAANQQPVTTQGGQYDVQRHRFVKPATIKNWALVIIADDEIMRNFRNDKNLLTEECQRFGPMYCKAGSAKGIQVGPMSHFTIAPAERPISDQDLKSNLRKGFEFYNSKGYDHIIFVLPTSREWIYSYLQYLEVDVPKKLKTVKNCTRASCIKGENFVRKILRGDQRSSSMFLSNLWLKYNTKLGGVNIALQASQTFKIDPKNAVNFLAPGYLFVSVDVCHPAPGDRLEQSVAAAVGMWNITNPNMSYCTRIRVQRKDKSDKEKSTVEEVGEIGVMFEEILQAYHKKMQKVPEKIVVLRDGVSEGQFQMVLRFELGQIKQQITNFYDRLKVAQPKLTCFTVQKRHKVRFMRKNPVKTRKGEDDYNIQPGTVVDNTVVQPNHMQFYMAPHKAIQGTSRAPCIYLIYDQINFTQDAAQAMIFALSYLSPRCTKGTSIPTPVNLADLAAERGKNIVVSWIDEPINHQRKMENEQRLAELNAFLSNMGDAQYQNTLYYV